MMYDNRIASVIEISMPILEYFNQPDSAFHKLLVPIPKEVII